MNCSSLQLIFRPCNLPITSRGSLCVPVAFEHAISVTLSLDVFIPGADFSEADDSVFFWKETKIKPSIVAIVDLI